MSIVTSFDSSDAPDDPKAEELAQYTRFLSTLESTQNGIVDTFTGLTKRSFRAQLPDARYMLAKEAKDLRPFWVSEVSVALDLPVERGKSWNEAAASDLLDLVNSLAYLIRNSAGSRVPIILVDSLKAKVTLVAPACLRFILRQKWTCTHG
jgi:hypothetical protein